MKLVETFAKKDWRAVECHYVCSDCGMKLFLGYGIPKHCPKCGRELNTKGKPAIISYDRMAALACAVTFRAVEKGILVDPLPKVKEDVGDYFVCDGTAVEEVKPS